jgi:hypothetical protein
MPDQDERDALVALEKVRGKPRSVALPNINLCGDIGLKIARDGTWYYQGGPIRRLPLLKLFASVLRHEDDGRYYLVTPVEKVPIEVEGMPFVAVEMTREGSGEGQVFTFRTNVDDVVRADGEHELGFDAAPEGNDSTPFILVRDGLKARIARSVYYELAALAVESPDRAGLGVWSGGTFFPFPMR